MLFRTDGWAGGAFAMYAPWDRIALQTHANWAQEAPHLVWHAGRDLSFILDNVHRGAEHQMTIWAFQRASVATPVAARRNGTSWSPSLAHVATARSSRAPFCSPTSPATSAASAGSSTTTTSTPIACRAASTSMAGHMGKLWELCRVERAHRGWRRTHAPRKLGAPERYRLRQPDGRPEGPRRPHRPRVRQRSRRSRRGWRSPVRRARMDDLDRYASRGAPVCAEIRVTWTETPDTLHRTVKLLIDSGRAKKPG